MALVEELLEHVSIKVALLALVSGYTLYRVYLWMGKQARMRSLGGGRAPVLPSFLPLGKSRITFVCTDG